MVDFFNKLKGMMVEDDSPTPAAPQAKPQAAPQQVQSPGSSMPTFQQGPVLNTAMVDAIRKATFSRNTALTALITASDALQDIIPDPIMRLKAAQKTAGAGRSAKEISEAISIHLNDVDAEELRFGQMLNTKIQTEVGGLNRQGDSAEQAIASANTEIQNLTQRIAQLQQSIGEQTANLSNFRLQAQTREADLRQSETEFKAAANAVRAELNGHKNAILSTLG
jgi:chromosome segregation ATPase